MVSNSEIEPHEKKIFIACLHYTTYEYDQDKNRMSKGTKGSMEIYVIHQLIFILFNLSIYNILA